MTQQPPYPGIPPVAPGIPTITQPAPDNEPVVTFSYRELWQQLLHELHEIKSTIGLQFQNLDRRVNALELVPKPPDLEPRVTALEKAQAEQTGGKLAIKDLYALAATLVGIGGFVVALLK